MNRIKTFAILLIYSNIVNGFTYFKEFNKTCDHEDFCFPHNACQNDCFRYNGVTCEYNRTKKMSCSHKFDGDYDVNDCSMEIPNYESVKCYDRNIEPIYNNYEFGDVYLSSNVINYNLMVSIINVTFTNISWTDSTFRFYVPKDPEICNFRSINVLKKISELQNSALLYDCPWSKHATEGKQGFFELKYGRDNIYTTKNFTFLIPDNTKYNPIISKDDLNYIDIQIFSYIDISNPNKVILNIQIPPKKILSKVNITNYDLLVNITNCITHNKFYILNFSNSDAVNGIYKYVFPTNFLLKTTYYFEIVPYNADNYDVKYSSSFTPTIKRPTSLYVQIGLYSLVIIISIIFSSLLFYYIKSKCQAYYEEIRKNSKILFVYSSAHNTHNNVIKEFAMLLKESYGIDILLDCIDIPKNRDKDPSHWLSEAFNSARYVVYFISPDQTTSSQDHPYRRLFQLACGLTKQELTKDYSNKEFLLVLLPYSSKEIPSIVKNFKKYKFFRDFNKFLDVILNKKIWDRTIDLPVRKHVYEKIKKIVDSATVEIQNPITTIHMPYTMEDIEKEPLMNKEDHLEENNDNVSENNYKIDPEAINMQDVLSGRYRDHSDEVFVPKMTVIDFNTLAL